MKRKLASIQIIESLESIPKADRIEKAKLQGLKWSFVVRKGEFEIGDFCVYFEIDSILPDMDWSENFTEKWIHTQKFRGQISQGLALPLTTLPVVGMHPLQRGKDVTELLGVTKKPDYVPEDNSIIKDKLPFFIQRTKEVRLESIPEILEKYAGIKVYITEKLNGESVTYAIHEELFYMCSRRAEIRQDIVSRFKLIDAKMRLRYILREYNQRTSENIAIQGELIGIGIEKNQYQLDSWSFYVFNVYDIDTQKYWNYSKVKTFCERYYLDMVPILMENYILPNDFDKIMSLVRGKSKLADIMREGIVIRTEKEMIDEVFGRVSFKIVDAKQLMKFNKKRIFSKEKPLSE